jgi:hypothetical protein
MKQITITRDEFHERIVKNKRGFGMVRALRETKNDVVEYIQTKLALEEIAQIIALMQIEEELFGKEGEENGNVEVN